MQLAVLAGAYPVSYTHLRAHETGAYLVCRLLLEKKTAAALLLCLRLAHLFCPVAAGRCLAHGKAEFGLLAVSFICPQQGIREMGMMWGIGPNLWLHGKTRKSWIGKSIKPYRIC